jgi:hypothetical protein
MASGILGVWNGGYKQTPTFRATRPWVMTWGILGVWNGVEETRPWMMGGEFWVSGTASMDDGWGILGVWNGVEETRPWMMGGEFWVSGTETSGHPFLGYSLMDDGMANSGCLERRWGILGVWNGGVSGTAMSWSPALRAGVRLESLTYFNGHRASVRAVGDRRVSTGPCPTCLIKRPYGQLH